ncbi:hypothetical protein ABPG72_018926 [Tetrahymena utriculariae]
MENSIRIQTDVDFHPIQSTKSNQSTQNKNMLSTQFRRFMAAPNNNGNQTPLGRNISPNETLKQVINKSTQQDFTQIFSVYTPSTANSKKRKKININQPISRPQRINTDIYEDFANHQILPTEINLNESIRVGSSCGRFLMPQSATNQIRNKSVGKDSVRSRVKNIVTKIYCGNTNQLNQMSNYYDSNLTNMIKPKRNKSSQGHNPAQRGESSASKIQSDKYRNEFTPSTSPQNRPISVFQGRPSKLNQINDSAKKRSVMSIDNENSLFQVSKNSDLNTSNNQFFQSTKNGQNNNFAIQFRNRQQTALQSQSQCASTTEEDQKQSVNAQSQKQNGLINRPQGGKTPITSNIQTKQCIDILISQQNQGKRRSQTQESEHNKQTTYNFLEYTKKNEQNKENNYASSSINQSKAQSRIDKYKDQNKNQQPSVLYQRKRIFTEFADDFEPQKEWVPQMQSDIRSKNQVQINFNQQDNSTATSANKSYNQSHNQSTNISNQHIQHTDQQQPEKNQQQQQIQNQYQQRIAQIVSQQQLQEKQQAKQVVHPKILYDMTDDEWNTFGDRFPSNFSKIRLLGRGGFALVWLGENNNTKEQYAIKQVSTKNVHQTHVKEIWFGSQFFENGQPKPQFKGCRGKMKYFYFYQIYELIMLGISNMIRLAGYDLKPVDTWLFYELSGDSLGTNLYDLKGEGKTPEGERIYKIIYKEMYIQMRSNLNILKHLIFELSHALLVISDQKIVHSDLKTENILIKTKPDAKNKKYLKLDQVKLIDYGSAFTFGNLKNFSMATPEYMAPEILNYILYTNNLNYNKQLVDYLKDYHIPHVIDIWSLGCVILELINGIPLWMSLKTKINFQGQELIKCGLFAVKNRVFESIIQKQIETINNLDFILNEQNYSNIVVDDQLRSLLKRMLTINPSQRISPREIIETLQPSLKGTI